MHAGGIEHCTQAALRATHVAHNVHWDMTLDSMVAHDGIVAHDFGRLLSWFG